MQLVHHLHPRLMGSTRPLRILLVGAGGSGSAVLLQLPFLEQALRAWGQPGLAVTVMDPDTVSEVNVVRQPFSHVDIGSNKAMCLVGRINMFWGFGWQAIPHAFGEGPAGAPECDLLISCVDTRKARHQIAESFTKFRVPAYHLDLGNNASSGQYVLGQPRERTIPVRAQEERLPTVFERFPEIADITIAESPLPSCSAVEALERQEPFINQTLAVSSLAMLARLLRYGQISYHGGFYNAETGRLAALNVDPVQFSRLLLRRAAKKSTAKGAARGRGAAA
jgi:PRTRC genetic system ThiF family protein